MFPETRGTFLRGPYAKDHNMLGTTLGSPYFGKLPCRVWSLEGRDIRGVPE